MGLTRKLRDISVAFGTASFFLADDDKTIRVDVDQGLLACIESPLPRTPEDYRERLVRHRREFSRIALLKYRAGLFKPEVRVLVVSITARDLI